MGLREKTKQKNQQKILQTAERKFKEQGYRNTSMTEIARDASVGTGTIYNYFPSKSALLITLFSEEMNVLRTRKRALEDRSGDFMAQLMQLLEPSFAFLHHYPKVFWRELIAAITEQSNEQAELLQQTIQLDSEAIEWFEELIDKHAHVFSIPIDRKQASFAIYSVLAAQTVAFLFDEDMTYEQFLDNIRQQIHFIFDGKIDNNKQKGD